MEIDFYISVAYVILLITLNVYSINTVYVTIRYLLRMLIRGRPSFSIPPNYQPTVTIQIPIYNENPKMIELTLKSVELQDYPKEKIEIVIIDQSDDLRIKEQVKKVVNEFKRTSTIPTKLVSMNRFGDGINSHTMFKPGALNLATKYHTNHEIIVVIDGDSYFHPEFLKHSMKHFYRKDIGMVACRHIIPHTDIISRWARVTQNFIFLLGEIKTALGYPHVVKGNGFIIRKEIVDKIPWDTLGEDIYMSLMAIADGWKVWCESKAIIYDEGVPTTFKALKKQWRRIIYGQGQAIKQVLSKKEIRWKILKDVQVTIHLFAIVGLVLPILLFPLNFILYYFDVNIDAVLALLGIFIAILTAFATILVFITTIRFGYRSDILFYPVMLLLAIHYLIPGALAFLYVAIGHEIPYYRTQRTGERIKSSIHDFEVVEFFLMIASAASIVIFISNFGAAAFFASYFIMMLLNFVNYTVKHRPLNPAINVALS